MDEPSGNDAPPCSLHEHSVPLRRRQGDRTKLYALSPCLPPAAVFSRVPPDFYQQGGLERDEVGISGTPLCTDAGCLTTTPRTPLDMPLSRRSWIDSSVTLESQEPKVRSGSSLLCRSSSTTPADRSQASCLVKETGRCRSCRSGRCVSMAGRFVSRNELDGDRN